MHDDAEQNLLIYHTADGKAAVSLYARDGNVWMNQGQLAELFSTSVQNISLHINNILKENELQANSVIKDYLTTAADGKQYKVNFYALDMILAIGFRVRSPRGTEFRKWANTHLKQYLVKGFVMDDERLKHPDGRADYFDELLARIRDIRASELRFYQKVRDLFAGTGRISHAQMEKQVNALYEQFDARRKAEQAIAADARDLEELNDVAKAITEKKRDGK